MKTFLIIGGYLFIGLIAGLLITGHFEAIGWIFLGLFVGHICGEESDVIFEMIKKK